MFVTSDLLHLNQLTEIKNNQACPVYIPKTQLALSHIASVDVSYVVSRENDSMENALRRD